MTPAVAIRRLFLQTALISGLLGGFLTPAHAQHPVESLGARPLGMGGAFVAVADDATATYWNPAGLATGPVLNLVVDRQDLGTGRPLSPEQAAAERSGLIVAIAAPPLGLGYYRLRTTWLDPENAPGGPPRLARSLVTHHTGVTVLQTLVQGLVVGSTLKFVRGAAAAVPATATGTPDSAGDLLDSATDLVGKTSNAFDLDVGAMADAGVIRVGLVLRNVAQPSFETPDGGSLQLDRHARLGVAVLPDPDLTLAADLDLSRVEIGGAARRMLAAGVERRWALLAARGGIRINTLGSERDPTAAFGLSVSVREAIWVDGHGSYGAERGDRGWGLAGRITF
jgi:hypothetical protein